MKKIFSGKVFDVLPLSDGIIFSYCKDVIDENTIVSYKMISFENGHFTDVARNIYLLTKFGNNYKATAMFCGNYITAKSIVLPNSKVFLLEDNGTAALLDNDATLLWSGELKYRGSAAADIALYKNTLWASLNTAAARRRILRFIKIRFGRAFPSATCFCATTFPPCARS